MNTSPSFTGRDWKYWSEPTIVDVAGTPTAYRRSGSGETVVYLHGGGGTRQWWPFHAALAEHFDLIAPEHPGFGDTPRPEHFDQRHDWVLHYEAFFRTLGLGRVHLVGSSLGGWLAADLAVTYPELFASVTLLVPLGLRSVETPMKHLFRVAPEVDVSNLFNGRHERIIGDFTQQGDFEDGITAYLENSTMAIMAWNPRYDVRLETRLSRISPPTLVIGVEDDAVIGNEIPRRFADLIPQASHLVIEGRPGEASSHGVQFEQPADVASAIRNHILTAR